jgi:hypothetical protein
MNSPGESEDSYEHYCIDCTAVVRPQDKVCGNCGADISQFIESDPDSGEDPDLDVGESVVLLSNERIISTRVGLILTSHRVRSESQAWGFSQIKSIMLEELASCVVTRLSHPILLVLAAVGLLSGMIALLNNRDAIQFLISAIILASVLVAIYFASRQQVLLLESNGAAIRINVQAENLLELRALINEIEGAKDARYLMRYSRT